MRFNTESNRRANEPVRGTAQHGSIPVDREGHSRAHLEDGPEKGERATLVFLQGVGHHDSSFGSPEKGRGYACQPRSRQMEEYLRIESSWTH